MGFLSLRLLGSPAWKHSAAPLALGSWEGAVYLVDKRELLVLDSTGNPLRRRPGDFQAAALGHGRAVTAREPELKVWRLADLEEEASWAYDSTRRTHGCENCQATALALDAAGIWLALSDTHYD
ncbi:MAG: hypothetical protein AB1758_27920, partial [Candidatus Eremiobacterota bacterium]